MNKKGCYQYITQEEAQMPENLNPKRREKNKRKKINKISKTTGYEMRNFLKLRGT